MYNANKGGDKMENKDVVTELLFRAYEERYVKDSEGLSEREKSFSKLCNMLNKEQRHALHDYDFLDFDFMIENQKQVIKYILELICPEI